ncbi:MAG: hypothetical protein QOE70_4784 [Chthoniobacter sp.]|jgi:hypothetical protein|nr:hypothetical protein [Chthoniobacter sp.]
MGPRTRFLLFGLAALGLAWLALAFTRTGRQAGRAQLSGQTTAEISSPAAAGSAQAHEHGLSTAPTATPSSSPEDDALFRPPVVALDSGPLAWEQRIAGATARSRNETIKARTLLALLPSLPEEALATTAEQAVANLPDDDYGSIALPVVTDPKTHGQALSVLFADLMERPDRITLPALLSIARNPSHSFSAAALDNLKLLLGADFGADWSKWDAAIQRKVAAGRP